MPDPIQTIARLYPRFMRAMGHLRGVLDESMDLTYNQYKALLSLSDAGPCTLNALSRELDVATSSTSQMVDRLVVMGLVERRQNHGDRRSIRLRISPEGERLLDKIREDILKRYKHFLRHLNSSEQSELAGAIGTLVWILEKAIEERKGE